MKHNVMAAEKQNLVSLPRPADDAGTIGTMCALCNSWTRLVADQTNFQPSQPILLWNLSTIIVMYALAAAR